MITALSVALVFVGSTPADLSVREQLGIPIASKAGP